MTNKLFARTTNQGTAASESALCERCFTEEGRAFANTFCLDDVVNDYEDCTGNDALTCVRCGYPDTCPDCNAWLPDGAGHIVDCPSA